MIEVIVFSVGVAVGWFGKALIPNLTEAKAEPVVRKKPRKSRSPNKAKAVKREGTETTPNPNGATTWTPPNA